jgi:hypothetical protein
MIELCKKSWLLQAIILHSLKKLFQSVDKGLNSQQSFGKLNHSSPFEPALPLILLNLPNLLLKCLYLLEIFSPCNQHLISNELHFLKPTIFVHFVNEIQHTNGLYQY